LSIEDEVLKQIRRLGELEVKISSCSERMEEKLKDAALELEKKKRQKDQLQID